MTLWFVLAGVVCTLVAFAAGRLQRMPLNAALLYLGIGVLLGPQVLGFLRIDPQHHGRVIKAITEVVIALSIFSGALKLRVAPRESLWFDPMRLAFLGMVLSVGGIMLAARYLLHLGWGAALLLGAILAPTDPVLASDVQVQRLFEVDRLRFTLTGEAGMNDGSALPLVTLGLGLTGIEPNVSLSFGWFFGDVVWGVLGALLIGGVCGYFGGRYMLHLRLVHEEKLGTDNLLALGIIGLSYGLTSLAHAIGFVGVFAAGAVVRSLEWRRSPQAPQTIEIQLSDPTEAQEAAVDPSRSAALMLLRLQYFTEGLESIGEVVVVIMVGSLLTASIVTGGTLIIAPLLFFVIRPLSAGLSLIGSKLSASERWLSAWFGIRGMGTVFYLSYLQQKGTPSHVVQQLADIAVGVVAYSIALHGTTVTPFMHLHERRAAQSGRP